MFWLCLLLLAWGQDNVAKVQGEWAALQLLRIEGELTRKVEEPIVIRDGALEITITDGILVPVFSGAFANDRQANRMIRDQATAQGGRAREAITERLRGSKDLVGFVFTDATASARLVWQERADNLIFANHMVRTMGRPRDAFLPVADGQPWKVGVTEGIVLSIAPEVRAAFIGPDRPDDPFEIVVYGQKPRPAAIARAKFVLEQRQRVYERQFIEAGRWIASDRYDKARQIGNPNGRHAILDIALDEDIGLVGEPQTMQVSGLNWLTLLRDETGATNSRLKSQVMTLGLASDGEQYARRISGEPFAAEDPNDPHSPPKAKGQMEQINAAINVMAYKRTNDVKVEVTARLRLRATDYPMEWADIFIPRAGAQVDWKLLSATTQDGTPLISETPLLYHDDVLGSRGRGGAVGEDARVTSNNPSDASLSSSAIGSSSQSSAMAGANLPDENGQGTGPTPASQTVRVSRLKTGQQDDTYNSRLESRVTLVFPEPIPPGGDIVIDVKWKDIWPTSTVILQQPGPDATDPNNGQLGPQEGADVLQVRGNATTAENLIPRLAGAPNGNPSKFVIRVIHPADGRMLAAVSGVGTTYDNQTNEEWYLVTSEYQEHRVPFVTMALGKWAVHDTLALGDIPGVRVRAESNSAARALGQEARQFIDWAHGYLPVYPYPELEVFESRPGDDTQVWVADHGLLRTQQAKVQGLVTGEQETDPTRRKFAHELAHQWWGQLVRPAHLEDFWFAEVFSESFAQAYMEAVGEDYEKAMRLKREAWSNPKGGETMAPRASLTDAYQSQYQPSIVYSYGPYVFQENLRHQLGHIPYHAALDLITREKAHSAITTEQLKDYFELAGDRPLDDWFDFWVYQGLIPKWINAEWSRDDAADTCQIDASVDIPFGRFDLPVFVDGEEFQIPMEHGSGQVIAPCSADPTLELDPEYRVLRETASLKKR